MCMHAPCAAECKAEENDFIDVSAEDDLRQASVISKRLADSEMRTHDGALQDDFSEQNRAWDDSGTIISDT